MNVRLWWVVFAAAVLLPRAGSSQLCAGFASFADGPLRGSAGAAFNDATTTFGAGLAYGGTVPFAQVTAGSTSYNDVTGTSFNLGLSGGFQFKADSQGIVNICPTAGVALADGPNDMDVFGDSTLILSLSETDITFGVSLGIVATRSDRTTIVPNLSLDYVNGTVKVEDQADGSSFSTTDAFGVLSLGVGFILNRTITLHPSVSIPLGLEGSSVAFGMTASLNFGGARQ